MSEPREETDRRDLLGVGAVAATLALDHVFAAGPGARVEDRASTIKITAMRGFPPT
jgi:hypothetical protein